jgi:hypothetical protein
MTHTITIRPGGRLEFIYADELAPLLALGAASIARASHVEPAPGGWTADMTPSGGPVLGPFPLRQTALDAEVAWLKAHRGL